MLDFSDTLLPLTTTLLYFPCRTRLTEEGYSKKFPDWLSYSGYPLSSLPLPRCWFYFSSHLLVIITQEGRQAGQHDVGDHLRYDVGDHLHTDSEEANVANTKPFY